VTALPSGAVGKDAFAESPWPLLSVTLGTNFPSLGVPSFAERSCQERSAKKVFFKKIKNIFADGEQATTLGKGFFFKK
jgi:hypothetical protein